jgi:hypothetical protein
MGVENWEGMYPNTPTPEKKEKSLLRSLAKAILLPIVAIITVGFVMGIFFKVMAIDNIERFPIIQRIENSIFVYGDLNEPEFRSIKFLGDGCTVEVYQNNQIYKAIYRKTSDSSFDFFTPEGKVVVGNFTDYIIKEDYEKESILKFLFDDIPTDSNVKLLIEIDGETETLKPQFKKSLF